MNTYVKMGLCFVAGIVIGAVASKMVMDYRLSKYEIDDSEDYDTDDFEDSNESNESEQEQEVEERHTDIYEDRYDKILAKLNYKAEEVVERETYNYEEVVDRSKPYYISKVEYEYDAEDAFEIDEYTYYADGYVTDSYGMPVSQEDVENSFGVDFHIYFDKYGEDEICIRNERLKMDFNIIRDLDNFVDVVPSRIRRMAGIE